MPSLNKIQTEKYILTEIDKMYRSLLRFCIAFSVVFLLLYTYLQVWPLAVLNFCGIILFFILQKLTFHNYKKIVIPFIHFEILSHSLLAIILLGWNYDFQLIILVMISTIYIGSNDYFRKFAYVIFTGVCVLLISRIVSFLISPIWPINPLYTFTENDSIILGIISTINIIVALSGMIATARINIKTNKFSMNFLNEENKVLNTLANIDPLTELLNRRFVYEYIEKMEGKPAHERQYNNFVIVLGDIDDFKDVNDTCGHETGDLVLKKVSEIMKYSLRDIDLICRWGGEEFLIIMPELSIDEAYKIIDDIRQYISQKAFHYDKYRFIVTMTFGMASSDHDTNFNEAVALADELLYKGKNKEKNKVIM